MIADEAAALTLIKERIAKTDIRQYELFVDERRREKAGEYIAVIVARVLPADTNCMNMSKSFLELFIDGQDIVWKRSFNTIIAEKQLRAVDFLLEAHIRL